MKPLSLRPWALILATALLVAACTGAGFVYRNADWFIKQWAASYFKLDGKQLSTWEPRLEEALRAHRRVEVPQLIGLMDGFAAGVRVGFDDALSSCLGSGLWQVYTRHAGYAADLLTPLLGLLTPEQIDKLAAQFAKEDKDPPSANPERRLRKRDKRFTSFAEWLVGPLTQEQQALVQKVNASIPDTGPSWFEHQQQQQRALLALLREHSEPKRIQAQLVDWWIDFADAKPTLRKGRDALESGMGAMIAGIGQSLTPAQKAHLLRQFRDLHQELMGENAKIKAVPLPCAPAMVKEPGSLGRAAGS